MKTGINRNCKVCGKSIKPRGMPGHMTLAHGVRIKTSIKYVYDAGGDAGEEMKNGPLKKINVTYPTHSVLGNRQEIEKTVLAGNTAQNLTDEKAPIVYENRNKNPLYSETDIKILLARLINYLYQTNEPTQLFQEFTIMDMIRDFEKRFECQFYRVKKENKHIRVGYTLKEHLEFARRYYFLPYSK